jgi:hypothetical protein
MRVELLVPHRKIVWKCTDSYIASDVLTDKSEWIGTRVIWKITDEGEQSTLTLIHLGLTKEVECIDLCTKGWNFYLQSIKQYLETGTGIPNKKTK